jgi:hypothetical protein
LIDCDDHYWGIAGKGCTAKKTIRKRAIEKVNNRSSRRQFQHLFRLHRSIRIEKLQRAHDVVCADILNRDAKTICSTRLSWEVMHESGISRIREEGSDPKWFKLVRDVKVSRQTLVTPQQNQGIQHALATVSAPRGHLLEPLSFLSSQGHLIARCLA